jgi:hypothetical protein
MHPPSEVHEPPTMEVVEEEMQSRMMGSVIISLTRVSEFCGHDWPKYLQGSSSQLDS